MVLCKRCWTQYDDKTLPVQCPHIEGPWAMVGGVPVPVDVCDCENCKGVVARPRQG